MQGIEGDARGSLNRPKAFLVAFTEYRNRPVLAFALKSTVRLSKALLTCGFDVQLFTDPDSYAKHAALFADLPTDIDVRTVKSAIELDEKIENWLDATFSWASGAESRGAPLGLFICAGHGSSSGNDHWLHLPGEEGAANGFNITKLQKTIGKGPLPVVLFVDTCRKASHFTTTFQDNATLVTSDEGEVVKIPPDLKKASRGDILDPNADLGALTIFSTPWNSTAVDSERDMLTCLARGIEPVDDPYSYEGSQKAKLYDRDVPALQHITELSLDTWIWYAGHLMGDVTQRPDPKAGLINLSMLVCSRDGESNRLSPPPVDLLEGFQARSVRGSGISVIKEPHGVVFHRVSADPEKQYNGFSFPPVRNIRGKTLLVEVVARKLGNFADTSDTVRCLLQPNHGGTFLSHWCRKPCEIPINEPKQFLIPLDEIKEGLELNSFALSTLTYLEDRRLWPVDATVTVTKLLLLDAESGIPEAEQLQHTELAARPFNLLTRWWAFGSISARPNQVVISKLTEIREKALFLLTIQTDRVDSGMQIGVTGPVYPSFRVSPRIFSLELIVHSFESQATTCKIKITVSDGDHSIAMLNCEITEKMLHQPILEKLLVAGSPTSITLVTDAEVLNIEAFRIVPRDDSNG